MSASLSLSHTHTRRAHSHPGMPLVMNEASVIFLNLVHPLCDCREMVTLSFLKQRWFSVKARSLGVPGGQGWFSLHFFPPHSTGLFCWSSCSELSDRHNLHSTSTIWTALSRNINRKKSDAANCVFLLFFTLLIPLWLDAALVGLRVMCFIKCYIKCVMFVLLQLSRVRGARRSPVSRCGDSAGGLEEKDYVEGGQETNGENTHIQTHTQTHRKYTYPNMHMSI